MDMTTEEMELRIDGLGILNAPRANEEDFWRCIEDALNQKGIVWTDTRPCRESPKGGPFIIHLTRGGDSVTLRWFPPEERP